MRAQGEMMSVKSEIQTVNLKHGDYEAEVAVCAGMNLLRFQKGNVQVIAPSTRELFDERFAGLGALIGPHFHRRRPELIPTVEHEDRFPHIGRVKAKGVQEPFSHGIARYAPWTLQSQTASEVRASLSGKDEWNGVPLAELQGMDFSMEICFSLSESGLDIHYSVVGEKDCLVGIHYYYHLPSGGGKVRSKVAPNYLDQGEEKTITEAWGYSKPNLDFDLKQEADYTFYPAVDPTSGQILLETSTYALTTQYRCTNQQNCWQLFHPKGADFVCIEPMSTQNPRKPQLTVSALDIQLSIG